MSSSTSPKACTAFTARAARSGMSAAWRTASRRLMPWRRAQVCSATTVAGPMPRGGVLTIRWKEMVSVGL